MTSLAIETPRLWTPPKRELLTSRSPWWRLPRSLRWATDAELDAAIGTPTARGSGTSTTNNATVTATLTTGSPRLVVAIAYSRSANTETCTFSGGSLTWTTALSAGIAANGGVHIGYAQDTPGTASGTITATLNLSSTRKALSLWEVTGLATTSPDDVPVHGTGSASTGNASATGAAATAQADEIIFFACKHNAATGTVTGTPSAGYTELDDFIVGTSTFLQAYASFKIASAVETPTPSVTYTDTTTNWQAVVVSFKGAAAAGLAPAFVQPRRRRMQALLGR